MFNATGIMAYVFLLDFIQYLTLHLVCLMFMLIFIVELQCLKYILIFMFL